MIPSRHTNPFATCWTRPGALPFRFSEGQSADTLVERLAAQGWWGEIVGPHGSGKSTLLAALVPRIRAAGREVYLVTLHNGQRRMPRLPRRLSADAQLIVDGYEQLGAVARWSLRRRCRRSGAGLIVTSHAPTGLPTFARLAPDLQLVEHLVDELTQRRATSIAPVDVIDSHASHGSNVREILFDLYDRHERTMCTGRTALRRRA